MRKFFAGLIILSVFAVIISLISLLMPSQVIVNNSILLHTSKDSALSLISDFTQWQAWHPYFQAEKPLHLTSGVVNWKKDGRELSLHLDSIRGNSVYFLTTVDKEKPVRNIMMVQPADSGVVVNFNSLKQLSPLPWNKFAGMMLKETLGAQNQQVLDKLKAYSESSK